MNAATRPKNIRDKILLAGIALARTGGPDAVVMREITRQVGVVPNAAYRHFKSRDELLATIALYATHLLSSQMEKEMSHVSYAHGSKQGAKARLMAIGTAYLDFSEGEPGLFKTAFSTPYHEQYRENPTGPTPFSILTTALDEFVETGLLSKNRRKNAEYAVWASVHGIALLIQEGALQSLRKNELRQIQESVLEFIIQGVSNS